MTLGRYILQGLDDVPVNCVVSCPVWFVQPMHALMVIVAPALIAAVLLIAKPLEPHVPVAPVVPPDGLLKRKGQQ